MRNRKLITIHLFLLLTWMPICQVNGISSITRKSITVMKWNCLRRAKKVHAAYYFIVRNCEHWDAIRTTFFTRKNSYRYTKLASNWQNDNQKRTQQPKREKNMEINGNSIFFVWCATYLRAIWKCYTASDVVKECQQNKCKKDVEENQCMTRKRNLNGKWFMSIRWVKDVGNKVSLKALSVFGVSVIPDCLPKSLKSILI